jgi:hypothetical protein
MFANEFNAREMIQTAEAWCPSAIHFHCLFVSLLFLFDFLSFSFCCSFSLSFSVTFSFLILVFYFHFTFCAISDAIFISMSVLFRNADLNLVCRSAPHYASSSPLPYLSRDVLRQSPPGAFHSSHRFVNVGFITLHKPLNSPMKGRDKTKIAQPSRDQSTT